MRRMKSVRVRSLELLLALVCVVTGAEVVHAQTVPVGSALHAEHLDAVYAERFAAWHEAVLAASPERLEIARAEGLLTRIAPLAWPLREQLDVLRRELGPELTRAESSLARLVDDLDLQAVPGAWSAGGERGPVLRVRVAPLEPVLAPVSGVARLIWLEPEGEQVARTVPFERAALSAPGFEAFVRAPSSAGEHHLVLEIEADGVVVRGTPLRLLAVNELDSRLEAVDRSALDAGGRRLLGEFERLLSSGLRQPWGLDAERALRALEGEPDAVPMPLVVGGEVLAPRALGARQGEGPVVVLVESRGVAPAGLVAGPRGVRWRAAMQAIDGLFAPIAIDERGLSAQLERFREAFPDRPLVVAPRPEHLLVLLSSAADESERGIEFFFQAIGPRAPFDGVLPGAVLGIDALPEGAAATAIPGSRRPLVNDLELGLFVQRWWSQR